MMNSLLTLNCCGIQDFHPLYCPRKRDTWPLHPNRPLGATWAVFILSHISIAKQQCLRLFHCLNLISSLLLLNSPITTELLSPLPFSASIQNLRVWGTKKNSSAVKSTGMSGYSECDCWENGAAVFVKWESETVCGFLEACIWEVHDVRAHFKLK